METERSTATESMLAAVKTVLADEYILMNKTSSCFLDPTSPFFDDKKPVFQQVYLQLKDHVEMIMQVLKQNAEKVFISISDIFSNTQLKNNHLFSSKSACIEALIDDHSKVINTLQQSLEDAMNEAAKEWAILFKQLKDSHTNICYQLNKYLKDLVGRRRRGFQQKVL